MAGNQIECVVGVSNESKAVSLAAQYLGFTKSGDFSLTKEDESIDKQIPILRSKSDGVTVVEGMVIIKYLTSLLRKDLSEAFYPIRFEPEINRWISEVAEQKFKCSKPSFLHTLNCHLTSRSFLIADRFTLADLVVFVAVHSWMVSSSAKERQTFINVVRWFDHIQNLPGIYKVQETGIPFVELNLETVGTRIPTVDHSQQLSKLSAAAAEGEDAAATTSKKVEVSSEAMKETQSGKKVDREKQQKKESASASATATSTAGKISGKTSTSVAPSSTAVAAAAAGSASERPFDDVTRLEIRVGQIVKVWNHPEADKLYCEEIHIGEKTNRRIASGLRCHIEIENLENQKVLVLANMKEKKLRGFGSHGMILCGKKLVKEDEADREVVELVKPPNEAKIGELLTFKGLSGEPDAVLSSKSGKDTFAAVQPDFRVDENGVAFYKGSEFMTSAGVCKCDSIRIGSIS